MRCEQSYPPLGGVVGQDESCAGVGSGCLLWFAKFQFDDVVSPRDRVQGAASVSAVHCVSNIPIRVLFPVPVRRPCQFARILPRRDGVGPTKKQTQFADILH